MVKASHNLTQLQKSIFAKKYQAVVGKLASWNGKAKLDIYERHIDGRYYKDVCALDKDELVLVIGIEVVTDPFGDTFSYRVLRGESIIYIIPGTHPNIHSGAGEEVSEP